MHTAKTVELLQPHLGFLMINHAHMVVTYYMLRTPRNDVSMCYSKKFLNRHSEKLMLIKRSPCIVVVLIATCNTLTPHTL